MVSGQDLQIVSRIGSTFASLDVDRDCIEKRRPQTKKKIFREGSGSLHPEAEPDRVTAIPPVHCARNRGEAGGQGRGQQVGQGQRAGGVRTLPDVRPGGRTGLRRVRAVMKRHSPWQAAVR